MITADNFFISIIIQLCAQDAKPKFQNFNYVASKVHKWHAFRSCYISDNILIRVNVGVDDEFSEACPADFCKKWKLTNSDGDKHLGISCRQIILNSEHNPATPAGAAKESLLGLDRDVPSRLLTLINAWYSKKQVPCSLPKYLLRCKKVFTGTAFDHKCFQVSICIACS